MGTFGLPNVANQWVLRKDFVFCGKTWMTREVILGNDGKW